MPITIKADDLVQSIADALQYVSYFHPEDYIHHLVESYNREESVSARSAMAQILVNSRMAALGRRPMCQDTGIATIFMKVGMQVQIDTDASLQDLVDEAIRQAWHREANPLRASVVADPLFSRRNTGDNTPGILHVELVPGKRIEIHVAAKGGGSENKSCFEVLNPGDSIVEWVLGKVKKMGAGWCPPGILGIGIGGNAERAMLLAKESLLEPADMITLRRLGPTTKMEALRLELWEKINALGIGAQGLGGLTTVVDVKIRTFPSHAASLPVAVVPQCAADRHLHFFLDGSGPAEFTPPNMATWPEIDLDGNGASLRRVNLDMLDHAQIAEWKVGETLLLSGHLLTARDAAHKRLVTMLKAGEPLPVDLRGRTIYYVGPVDPVEGEAVGPAGPTTSTRMDSFIEPLLAETGLLVTVGKAERGQDAIDAIARHRSAYLIAVGGAAYLVSKAIRSSRIIAFEDLGMEAIREFEVEDMPVTVAVDTSGNSVHTIGPARWRKTA